MRRLLAAGLLDTNCSCLEGISQCTVCLVVAVHAMMFCIYRSCCKSASTKFKLLSNVHVVLAGGHLDS